MPWARRCSAGPSVAPSTETTSRSDIAAKSPISACAWIYAAYAPGFVIYATKFPKNKKWGYHEWFHISVLMGNLVSMGFDLGILGLFKPCAEGVACASLASRLTFGLLP